jgi:hypothetical protein
MLVLTVLAVASQRTRRLVLNHQPIVDGVRPTLDQPELVTGLDVRPDRPRCIRNRRLKRDPEFRLIGCCLRGPNRFHGQQTSRGLDSRFRLRHGLLPPMLRLRFRIAGHVPGWRCRYAGRGKINLTGCR